MDLYENMMIEPFDEEFNKVTDIKEEEDFFKESLFLCSGMGSSSMDIDDDDDWLTGDQLETIDPHKVKSEFFRRAMPKKQEIKDVVKDNILAFLPAKTLARFRSVSKEWDKWIKSPLFSLHQSYFFHKLSGFFCQYEESGHHIFTSLNRPAYGIPKPSLNFLPDIVNIRSSSNGLLLCQGRNTNSYYICNPATKTWRELPETNYFHTPNMAIVLSFKPSLLEIQASYQVICAVPLFGQPIVCFEVYSSETRSWHQSDVFCAELGYTRFKGDGFYMNGMAYWETTERDVVAFDVKSQSYEIISLPSESPSDGVLTWMNDELCYIGISNILGNEYSIKIYGVMDLQLKSMIGLNLEMGSLDKILDYCPYQVLPCFEDGVVMILVGSLIYSYRIWDQKTEVISREGVGSSCATARYLPYVNSLVALS